MLMYRYVKGKIFGYAKPDIMPNKTSHLIPTRKKEVLDLLYWEVVQMQRRAG